MAHKDRKRFSICFAIIQTAILIGLVENCILHNLCISVAIKYMLFQFFCVFIPGYVATRTLGKKLTNLVSVVVISYAIGLFVLVLEYLITITTGISSLLSAILVSLISCVIILRKDRKVDYANELEINKAVFAFLLVIVSVLYLVCLFCVSARNTMPIENGGSNINENDYMYWIANTISLSKSFPPINIRLYGDVIYYHYFSSIIIAQTSRIIGINIQILSFYLSYIIPVLMMVLASCFLVQNIAQNNVIKCVAIFGILFTEGTSLTYLYHIYYNPFGFDYGYFFGMISIGWLLKMSKGEDSSLSTQIIAGVLIFMTTGCKGPVAVVILIGYAVYGVYLLCKRKIKTAVIGGIIWIASFLTVYIFFIGGLQHSTGAGGLSFVGIEKGFTLNAWIQYLYSKYELVLGTGILSKAASIVGYIFNINWGATIGLLIAIVALPTLCVKKKNDISLLILIIVCIWGIVLTLVTYQDGTSQMYFAMAMIPYGVCGGAYVFDCLIQNKNNIAVAVMTLQLLGILAGCYVFAFGPGDNAIGSSSYYGQTVNKMRQGYNVWKNGLGSGVSVEEYQTYNWIKENTPSKAVFAIDKSSMDNPHYQELIVFGEKYVWNDGMYDRTGEIDKRNRILTNAIQTGDINKELGSRNIDYLLVPFTSTYLCNIDDQCKLVYKNSVYSVYRLLKR